MTSPVMIGALAGYSAKQIISYLTKAFPNLAPRIQKAQSSGFKPEQILDFMSKTMQSQESSQFTSESEIHKFNREKNNQITKQLAQFGLQAGGIGLGLKALSQTGIGQNLMSGLKNVLGGGGGMPGGQQPSAQSSGAQPNATQPLGGNAEAPQPQQATQAPSPTQPNQPQTVAQQPPSVNSSQILQNLGLSDKITNLLNQGNNPEQITSQIESSLNQTQRKNLDGLIKKGQAKPLREMIEDLFAQNLPGQQKPLKPHEEVLKKRNEMKKKQGLVENLYQDFISAYGEGNLPESMRPKEQEPSEMPKKGAYVSAGEGTFGTLKDMKEKEALVEADGKLHKVKANEVIESPLPEKELAELYDDLIKGVEKESGQEVSRNVNWAGYDPNDNSLAYLPHDGSLYVYKDLSEEEVKELTSLLNTRKTTGENFIGGWSAGSGSPIGAGMSKLIQKLQKERGGKGNEYANKFQTVYNYLEPAVKAAKAAKKKKK